MTDQEHDESRKKIDEDRARYEAAMNTAATEAKQSEDRYAEILERISKQLEDIEDLLRQKLNTNHDKDHISRKESEKET
jgi:Mg2+ and Co2+ transporter CorA